MIENEGLLNQALCVANDMVQEFLQPLSCTGYKVSVSLVLQKKTLGITHVVITHVN